MIEHGSHMCKIANVDLSILQNEDRVVLQITYVTIIVLSSFTH